MRQHGHVAMRQVEEAGLTRPALHYQVRAGLFEPVARGVYRFTTFPPDDREHEATAARDPRSARRTGIPAPG